MKKLWKNYYSLSLRLIYANVDDFFVQEVSAFSFPLHISVQSFWRLRYKQ